MPDDPSYSSSTTIMSIGVWSIWTCSSSPAFYSGVPPAQRSGRARRTVAGGGGRHRVELGDPALHCSTRGRRESPDAVSARDLSDDRRAGAALAGEISLPQDVAHDQATG
ncbi:hypothetical protein ACIQUM_05605 [Amycolatopsis azurea]|uniref:hypothetical protein n=1 Tax=Amycolatopsis azurea TaxID=36819 RepID=UPI0038144FFC